MIKKFGSKIRIVAFFVVIIFGSAFLTQGIVDASTNGESIIGVQVATADQMAAYALSKNPSPKINCTMLELAKLFLAEGAIEGVRGDIAFAQACKETGYFAYGGRALPEWNNYSGLGVTGAAYDPGSCTENQFATGVTVIKSSDGSSVGVKFSEPRLGVRALIQHLKGYATSEPLKQALVDPRYSLISKGIAPNWVDLNGRWAVPGTNYGQEILSIYNLIEQTPISIITVHPTSVSLNKTTDSIAIGATDKLTATIAPITATNKSVTWSSSDATIASVASDGTVTGVKTGAATITAKTVDGGLNASCKVNVSGCVSNLAAGKVATSSTAVTNISLVTDGSKDTNTYFNMTTGLQWIQLDLGTTYNISDIKLWHYFSDARKYHDVVVQLSNDSTFASGVTTVFNNDTNNTAGRGTGTGSEYAETSTGKDIQVSSINARYARFYSNGSSINAYNHYVEVEIYGSAATTVVNPISVVLNKTADTLTVGGTDALTATVMPADASNKNVTWTSSATGVATVSSTGLVNAVSAGTATITAKTADGSYTASCAVTVNNLAVHPTSVSLNKTTDSIAIGATDKLTATVAPTTATNKSVTWSSSDATIASVASDGIVKGVKTGAATITARTADGGFTAACKVNVTGSLSNLAAGKLPAALSAAFKNLSLATDGVKSTANYADSSTATGLQWVQVDLGNSYGISSIKLWHYFGDARKYSDVVVQLSDDPKFISGITTVYNNDTDNSAGLGKGTNSEYSETSAGLNITFGTVNARYARFYTNGSNINKYNHYSEIEIYGK